MSHRLLVWGAVLSACTASYAVAETQAQRVQSAQNLVKEALHREIYGLQQERDQLLQQALQKDPQCRQARWHLGLIQHDKQWLPVEAAPAALKQDPRWEQYRRIRDTSASTVASQLQMANWCRKRNMAAQERAHLHQVIAMSKDHPEARQRLGFVRVGADWRRQAEMAENVIRQQTVIQSVAQWRKTLVEINHGLDSPGLAKRENAVARLRAIADPKAAVAIAAAFAESTPDKAMLMVEVLGKLPGKDVSLLLARQAVVSQWPQVREAAAIQLRDRKADGFVPQMLAQMFTPVETRTDVGQSPNGRLLVRNGFIREGHKRREFLVLNTEYRRRVVAGGDRRETLSRALADARNRDQELQQAAMRQNQWTLALNERIATALNTALEQDLPPTPQAWWDWWNQENDIVELAPKEIETLRYNEEIAVIDFAPVFTESEGSGLGVESFPEIRIPPRFSCECLAAGTLVWTDRGPLPIQILRPGDLVLSQHPDSGELAYKPILRTTIRPPKPLINIHTIDERMIEATDGHPFWVAGEGWVLAKNLRSGMELHCAGKTLRIRDVSSGENKETYNLVVEDFQTYFIGDSKILSHDVTERRATNAIVPGLTN